MSETERIVDQLRRAAEGEAWHGPSLRELLADVDAGRAATRAIPGAHTIWELVLHITTWRIAAARRLRGERAEPSDEEDWPAMPEPSEAEWQRALARMDEAGRELRSAVQQLDDERLDQPIVAGMPTTYQTLHGVVQHDLYHAGQIAVLRRAVGMGLQL